MLTPLRDRNFRHFLGLNFGFTLATAFIGQYLWLYVLDTERGLGWSNLRANLLIIAVPMIGRSSRGRGGAGCATAAARSRWSC